MNFSDDFLIREMRSKLAAGEHEAARLAMLKELHGTPTPRRWTARTLLRLAHALSPELRVGPAVGECEAC